ncbi:hypothetical protein OY671_012631, partial [Metschnikowia pulcherrima]
TIYNLPKDKSSKATAVWHGNTGSTLANLKRRRSMKLHKLSSSGAMALSASSMSAAHAKDWKTVTITLEGAYAPWNVTNPDGTSGGFEPESAAHMCAEMKVE